MREWIPYASLFVTALVVTLVATPLARIIATRLGAVDKPSKRRINKRTIPRMGGIAIFLALVAAAAVQIMGTRWLGWPSVLTPGRFSTVNYPLLGVSFLVIFLTGAIDDVVQLKPLAKLAARSWPPSLPSWPASPWAPSSTRLPRARSSSAGWRAP